MKQKEASTALKEKASKLNNVFPKTKTPKPINVSPKTKNSKPKTILLKPKLVSPKAKSVNTKFSKSKASSSNSKTLKSKSNLHCDPLIQTLRSPGLKSLDLSSKLLGESIENRYSKLFKPVQFQLTF
jgi:hypothetical protein